MLDPFPLPAPPLLVKASKPICDALQLRTLPYHLHEVAFALLLYSFINAVVSPALSNFFVGQTYQKLNRRTRINWNVHVVSFFQSVIICTLSIYIIRNDEQRKGWAEPGNWEKRIWAYDGATGFLQSMALGYFLWDLYMCSRYVNIFGWGMLAHAISAVTVFAFGYRPFVYYYAPTFLLYELSSPFLNIHWFCDKLDLTGSIYQAINGAFLTLTFFLCRLVWGAWASYTVFSDFYNAYLAGHTDPNHASSKLDPAEMLQGGRFTDPISGLRFSNIDPKTGNVTAYMNPVKYVPIWLAAAYFGSNLVLNLLNYFWFSKMIETIRKRFDPPFGTKGKSEKQDAEAEKLRRGSISSQLGEGEVPMDGNFDALEGDVVRMGGKPQLVDVSRSVYADGHKSVEVAGKTLRSRRKA